MGIIISIYTQKGGSAKTTTAINFAAFAGARKRKILLIDLDAQGSATIFSGIAKNEAEYSICDVLTGGCDIKQAVRQLKYYDIIPANSHMQGMEFKLSKLADVYILKTKIQSLKNGYDYIVLDCPPAINPVTITALVASDTIIIPVEPKPMTVISLSDLINTINEIYSNRWNDDLYVLGILMIRYNTRTKLNKRMEDLINQAAASLDTTVFDCSIRECTAVAECQEKQIPLPDYKPTKNNGAIDYNGFTTRVLQKLEGE